MYIKRLADKAYIISFLLAVTIISSCSKNPDAEMIILNEVPQTVKDAQDIRNSADIPGAKLMAINPQKKEDPVNLTKDFYSAVSPQISYDGKFMLFSAKKEADSPWQIWEMKLNNLKSRQITSFSEDCISPAYLPGNRVIFSRLLTNDTVKTSYVLFAGSLDGTDFKQISFSPQSFTATTTLSEGRALSTVKQVYPEETESKLMVFRPDGTKVELFYKSKDDFGQISKARESNDGKILFVEYNADENKSEIISLNYSNPAQSRKVVFSGKNNDFLFVAPYKSNQLFTSKSNGGDGSVLCGLNSETKELTEIWKSEACIVDAVKVEVYARPRNLPSDVKPGSTTGLLVCQDINFTGLKSIVTDGAEVKATKVEILGVESSLGIVDVEEDGSFYLKIDADVPFRIQTLSADGEVINGPGSWYYIRPNERRGCVGCHTGPDISPFNRQPLSVLKEPVTIQK